MKKLKSVSEEGKVKSKAKKAEGPAEWYMMHELLSPPLSFRLHPYLRRINCYYFQAKDRSTR